MALQQALVNTFTAGRGGRTYRPVQSLDRLEEQREKTRNNFQRQQDSRLAKNITESQKNLLDAYRKATIVVEGEVESSERKQQAVEEYADALDESIKVLKTYTGKYRDLIGKSLYNQLGEFKVMQKNTHGLTSALAASQRNTSLLSAALIESFNEVEFGTDKYRVYMGQLNDAVSKLDRAFLQQSDFIDEQTGGIRDNLSPEDFANIRKTLGEAQTAISENLGKLGVQNLGEFMKSGEGAKLLGMPATDDINSVSVEFQQSLLVLAKQLEKMGYQFEGLDSPESIDWENLANKIAKISDTSDAAANELNKIAKNANTVAGSLLNTSYMIASLKTKFIKPLVETGSILASIAATKDATIDVMKQIANFNIASIPASFMDVQLASVKLGMSFEDTVSFLQENKRALALYGPKGGAELLNTMTPVFESFGYSLKQASEIVGPAIEAGIMTGINIRSGEQLNNFIEDSMKSFKNISSIVNISAKEYMALNAELLGSSDMQGLLLGMDRDRAIAYSKQLIALRDNYVALGLTTQQAQELVSAQEAQKREEATSRVREGAKGMVLAKQLGLSDQDAQRYFKLSMLGTARSVEEGEEFIKLSQQMGLARQQKIREAADTRDIGQLIMTETMVSRLSPEGGAARIMEAAQPLSTAERANIQVTDATAAMAKALGMGSKAVAEFQGIVESVSSFFKNSLVIAAGSAALSLTGLAFQAYAASRALGTISGSKGIMGSIFDKILGKKDEVPGGPDGKPGDAKRGGKIQAAGKVAGGLAAVAAPMLLNGLDIGGKVESWTGSAGLGALSSILASTAAGAGGGFMAGGPWGALAGGLYGLSSSVYSNWDSIMSSVRGQPKIINNEQAQRVMAAENDAMKRTAASSGVINTTDASANEKLQIIADNIVKIVGILQVAAEEKKTPAASVGQKAEKPFSLGDMNSVPSGLSYITAA